MLLRGLLRPGSRAEKLNLFQQGLQGYLNLILFAFLVLSTATNLLHNQ